MEILIMTNYFPPEIGGASHLYYELAESLVRRGHEVTVVTGFPRYNVKKKDKKYRGKFLIREEFSGIEVIRVWIPEFPRENLILRGVEHFWVAFAFIIGSLFTRKPQVIIFYSPPLPIGLSAYFIGKLKGIPFIINVQDLFPKEAVLLGLLKNKMLIKFFEMMERFIYKRAAYITVHSPGNLEHIVRNGGNREKVGVVYNWVDVNKVKPGPRKNHFRKENSLNDEFVVSYAGTMGWCQDMGVIVDAANELRKYKDIVFLLVGEGPLKKFVEAKATNLGLENVKLLPVQPFPKYLEILMASDVCLINLNENLTTPVVPSKLLNIMASGRPIVASLPDYSDARRIIEEANCGYCVPPRDPHKLAKAILTLYNDNDLREEMGSNGRIYAERYFEREGCVSRYEEIFFELCKR